ncbi:hypothetical protein H7Y40_02190 [Pedobacter sp.]|nr:hypothetical protein [Candidatus Saccharibacteria bacterium]
MSGVYELNGEVFTSVELYLEALAHEYKTGDSELVLTKLDDDGLALSDLGVRPAGA